MNARPSFENRRFQFLLIGLFLFVTLVLPFFWVVVRDQRWMVSVQSQLILLLRILGTGRFDASWLSLLLYPLSISMALALTGKLALKQRQYEWSAKIDIGADSNVTRDRE